MKRVANKAVTAAAASTSASPSTTATTTATTTGAGWTRPAIDPAIVAEFEVRWTATPPRRLDDGTFAFADVDSPDAKLFRPNRSPAEVMQAGAFGGTYFRPIRSAVLPGVKFGDEVWKQFPAEWFAGLDPATRVKSSTYRADVNKYRVKSGASLEEWENSGWMRKVDPYGWFMWYCFFFLGRRCNDDDRQIKRWLACAGETGRWRNRLCKTIWLKNGTWDDTTSSPVIRQTLLHWGYELPQAHYRMWGAKQGVVAGGGGSSGKRSRAAAGDDGDDAEEVEAALAPPAAAAAASSTSSKAAKKKKSKSEEEDE